MCWCVHVHDRFSVAFFHDVQLQTCFSSFPAACWINYFCSSEKKKPIPLFPQSDLLLQFDFKQCFWFCTNLLPLCSLSRWKLKVTPQHFPGSRRIHPPGAVIHSPLFSHMLTPSDCSSVLKLYLINVQVLQFNMSCKRLNHHLQRTSRR